MSSVDKKVAEPRRAAPVSDGLGSARLGSAPTLPPSSQSSRVESNAVRAGCACGRQEPPKRTDSKRDEASGPLVSLLMAPDGALERSMRSRIRAQINGLWNRLAAAYPSVREGQTLIYCTANIYCTVCTSLYEAVDMLRPQVKEEYTEYVRRMDSAFVWRCAALRGMQIRCPSRLQNWPQRRYSQQSTVQYTSENYVPANAHVRSGDRSAHSFDRIASHRLLLHYCTSTHVVTVALEYAMSARVACESELIVPHSFY